MRPNSRVLCVTTTRSCALPVAAINRSFGPTGRPDRSTSRRIAFARPVQQLCLDDGGEANLGRPRCSKARGDRGRRAVEEPDARVRVQQVHDLSQLRPGEPPLARSPQGHAHPAPDDIVEEPLRPGRGNFAHHDVSQVGRDSLAAAACPLTHDERDLVRHVQMQLGQSSQPPRCTYSRISSDGQWPKRRDGLLRAQHWDPNACVRVQEEAHPTPNHGVEETLGPTRGDLAPQTCYLRCFAIRSRTAGTSSRGTSMTA